MSVSGKASPSCTAKHQCWSRFGLWNCSQRRKTNRPGHFVRIVGPGQLYTLALLDAAIALALSLSFFEEFSDNVNINVNKNNSSNGARLLAVKGCGQKSFFPKNRRSKFLATLRRSAADPPLNETSSLTENPFVLIFYRSHLDWMCQGPVL